MHTRAHNTNKKMEYEKYSKKKEERRESNSISNYDLKLPTAI